MASYTLLSISYLLSTVLLLFLAFKKYIPDKFKYLSYAILLAALGFQFTGLIMRWIEASHAPFANMYESLVTFSFVIILEYFLVENLEKSEALGIWVLPVSWLMLGFALYLPPVSYLIKVGNILLIWVFQSPIFPIPDRVPEPLSPALQSFWFQIHVPVFFLSYGAFTLAFGAAGLRLIHYRKTANRLDILNRLDQQIYLFISIGFIFLTAGIITGAIWAREAWSRYWSWDPKEVWSLIVWLIYASYFHLRLKPGWKGEKTAWFAILGFVAVFICYYGVNVAIPVIFKYSQGLHSYGAPDPIP